MSSLKMVQRKQKREDNLGVGQEAGKAIRRARTMRKKAMNRPIPSPRRRDQSSPTQLRPNLRPLATKMKKAKMREQQSEEVVVEEDADEVDAVKKKGRTRARVVKTNLKNKLSPQRIPSNLSRRHGSQEKDHHAKTRDQDKITETEKKVIVIIVLTIEDKANEEKEAKEAAKIEEAEVKVDAAAVVMVDAAAVVMVDAEVLAVVGVDAVVEVMIEAVEEISTIQSNRRSNSINVLTPAASLMTIDDLIIV
jgi:hypothetical protein